MESISIRLGSSASTTSSGDLSDAAFQSVGPLSLTIRRVSTPPMLWPISTIRSIAGSCARGSKSSRIEIRDDRRRAAEVRIGLPVE